MDFKLRKQDDGAKDTIQVLDYSKEHHFLFMSQHFVPYLTDLFKDLNLRTKLTNNTSTKRDVMICKNTFLRFTNLPGIINDRLYALCTLG